MCRVFVIVDLEWVVYKKGHYEITQLSAIRVNDDWDAIGFFSSFIKPKNMAKCDWSHPAYTGGNCDDFANAKSAYTVWSSFNEWLRNDDVLLLWNYEERIVFRRLELCLLKKNQTRKPVILDSLVHSYLKGQFSSTGSPYKIAAARGIKVNVNLQHYSPNDVRVLRELMQIIAFPQHILLNQSEIINARLENNLKLPYQYHKETNTIHKRKCELITLQNLVTFGCSNLENAIKCSYKFCDCCKSEYKEALIEYNKSFIKQAGFNYIFSPSSKIYHKTTCKIGLAMKNIIGTKKYKNVVKAGRRPCQFCKPSSEEEYRRMNTKDKILRSQIKTANMPPKEDVKAIIRQRVAAEERQRRLLDDELTETEKADIYTLTQPRFAFWVGQGYQNFHTYNCHKLKGLSNLRGFSTYKEAVKAGFTPCKHCKPTKKDDATISIPITNCVRKDEKIDDIIPLCEEAGFTYYKENEYFHIETSVGKWKIIINSSPIKLDHINLAKTPNEYYYHEQPRKFLSYADVVEYIKRHDSKLMKKPTVI